MGRTRERAQVEREYEEAAQRYLSRLPLVHFMEATTQARQREITLSSFALLSASRPDFQYFSELLVQYPFGRPAEIHQVVPDNMVVLHPSPIEALSSFNLPVQDARPFWVLEYVSPNNKRKDYEDSFHKYERELKVPYYLLFYPDNQELTLYRHERRRYRSVPPDADGRCPLPELDLHVGLVDGWARYWSAGQLLPLPADLQRGLQQTRQLLDLERDRADREAGRADREAGRADREHRARLVLEEEVARLRARLGLSS